MDNVKIGSIVRCNAQDMVYSNLNGLVYDLRWVGGQRHPIATVAFEYETRTREISTESLTSVGEIEPAEYIALNYRPGTRPKLHEDYIIDHIELTPKLCQFGQDTAFYKVSAIVTLDNNTFKNICRTLEYNIASNLKEENNMLLENAVVCMSKVKDARVPSNPTEITYDDVAKYCQNDISVTKQAVKVLLNSIYGIHSKTLKEEIQMKTKSQSACNPIKKVIFNDPATIVFWKDGTKTIVKCQEGATFDPEKGLAMAISRHYLCDICGLERYDGVFKRYVPKEMKK